MAGRGAVPAPSPRAGQCLTKQGPSRREGPCSFICSTHLRNQGVVPSVDRNRCLLVEALGLVMPVGGQGPERGLDCAGVVAAEKQLTAGGLEYNADICLSPATIASVSCV